MVVVVPVLHCEPDAATEHQRRLIGMQGEQTGREADTLVYDLNNPSPDEIAVVESSVGEKG